VIGLEATTFQRSGRLETKQLEVVLVPVFEGVNSERAVMAAAEQARASGKELMLMVVVEVPKSLPEGFSEYAKTEWRGRSRGGSTHASRARRSSGLWREF
jgi:hypothetical protein